MKLIFVLAFILPSALFAQVNSTEAYYRQALKKFDSVKTMPPDSIRIPSIRELDKSPSANEYLDQEMFAASRYGMDRHRDKDEFKRQAEKDFGIPFDSILNLANKFGERYLIWLYARHLLPPAIQEQYLFHRLDEFAREGSIPQARRSLSDLEQNFPQSKYIKEGRAKVQALEAKVTAGKKNVHIVFRSPVHSLDELIAPYKGKIVYLDIWGTWCGPCKEEMKYAHALKQNVDTAKVVFVYLDMDRDEVDSDWREYVQMHNITGEHLRMNEGDMEAVWETLLHTSHVARYYPSFFIFGRDGRVVEANAKRPSDKEELYKQLKEAIDAP